MRRLRLLFACWLLGAVYCGTGAAAPLPPDTRVLIDISGSMKQNDPQNLRRPALRLLVGLLPTDSRAGVWTFGQYVNMQVPLGKVNDAWRERARQGAGKIHSRGLFTDIEQALVRATSDWNGPPDGASRHVVLLTDGMVDVSKNSAESAASRRRILEQQLPGLRDMGVKIHTVALSSRADHELMQNLSRITGGWYEQAQSAAALQKVFLRIFEQVGNPDTVPLKDNKFKVDESIRELTLIVFRPSGAAPTKVTLPSGEQFEQSAAPGNVVWHQDEGYDLLTVTQPMAGEWRIQAQIDPDNRVVVLTDLRMEVDELPNRILAGQRLSMEVVFEQEGQLITQREFIDLMQLSAEQVGPDGYAAEPQPVRDDGNGNDPLAYDGRFEFRFEPGGGTGKGELVISAEGKTFQREKRALFELTLPARAELQAAEDSDKLQVRVTPDPDVVEAATLEAVAELALADGSHQSVVLSRQDDNSFTGELDPATIAGAAELTVRVRARSNNGDTLGTELPPLSVQGKLAPPPTPEPEPMPTASASTTADPPADQDQDTPQDNGMDMLIWIGAANLLLLVLGGAAFWLIRRRGTKDPFQLVEETEEPSDPEPTDEAQKEDQA
jgi:uncharacterized protein (TIGR03503 family)